MKKFLALVLVALMVVPFAVMTSAAVPDEPVAATDVPVIYCADSAVPEGVTAQTGSSTDPENKAGETPTLVLKTTADPNKAILFNKVINGAKLVWVGKGYFTNGNTFPDTGKPVVITAHDGTTDYISRNEDGSILYMNESKANAGQFGMFLMNKATKVNFECDTIFEKIVILNRAAETDAPSTIVAKKRLVIADSVQFATMKGPQYNLEVAEGAYAYLHALGFAAYEGKGTIVVGNEIKDKIHAGTFAGFEGQVVFADGSNALVGLPAAPETTAAPAGDTTAAPAGDTTAAPAGDTTAAPAGTTAATPETTKAPEVSKKPASTGTYTFEVNTKAPETTAAPADTAEEGGSGALIGIIAAVVAVAVIAVVAVIVIKKKKAE